MSSWRRAAVFASLLSCGLISGCSSNGPSADTPKASDRSIALGSVAVLVIDADDLAPLIERQWRARTDEEITVRAISWDEAVSASFEELKQHDAVIYPNYRLGDLAERNLLRPLDAKDLEGQEFNRREILQFDRIDLVNWGEQIMGASLGESPPVVLYRSDVLERLNREPPETWDEFSRLVESLSEIEPGDGLPTQVSVPLHDHWASYMLLARAAASIRSRGKYSSLFDVSNMSPLIASEPFSRALVGWVTDLQIPQVLSPRETLLEFVQGRSAIAIAPINAAWLAELDPDAMPPATVAPLPGSIRRFDATQDRWVRRSDTEPLSVPLLATGGLMVSVTEGAARARNAETFLSWLAGKKLCTIIGTQTPSCGMSRKSHLGNPRPWIGEAISAKAADQYVSVIRNSNEARLNLFALRIPSRDRYLTVLDDAVRKALDGSGDAESLLKAVAATWDEITDELGREAMRTAYRHSEGLKK